ncbi:hypothetical protein [Bradyrhizobium sp.]|uniref:hypothetical protein n=1 Tax=Bradyrhizobium sp. TaxID=376 RepID=UPI002D2F3115|nr:hypothetical protein [Bradyrhizobium sp.]HZR71631.1 hypothetical protein [Bradyrhizobium sp.]
MMNGVGAHRALTIHVAADIVAAEIVAADIVINRGVTVAETAAARRAREIGPGVSRGGRPATEMTSASGEMRCTAAASETAGSPAGKMSTPEMRAADARSAKVPATEMRSSATEMASAEVSATTAEVCAASAEVRATAAEVRATAATVKASAAAAMKASATAAVEASTAATTAAGSRIDCGRQRNRQSDDR